MAQEIIPDNYIGLNVGGKIYQTSRTTLLHNADSFFSGLLDGDIPSAKDDQGNYRIDQDGEIFRHVLNFLRYGKLVLPADFNEYDLLECQADFFQLLSLKSFVKRITAGIVGLVFTDGKVFETTRKTLMREENSFFPKMLNQEVNVARDAQGNYVIDRDSSVFRHVLGYLEKGAVLDPITDEELDSLDKDAEYFQLKILASHLQSIRQMKALCPYPPCFYYYFVLYLSPGCEEFAVYIRSEQRETWHLAWHFEEEWGIDGDMRARVSSRVSEVIPNVCSGIVGVNDLDLKERLSTQHLMDMLKINASQSERISQHPVSLKFTRVCISDV